ncbi:hypothetical protein V0R55_24730 [Pseudomonas soli]|uniref:Integrase n=1 Tax=Pseudomonas soli TaxID=1306993 RepID=A0ABU7GWE6_9PSED|nr:hypothetical protein [Pseudomonas soli]MEE1883374.1 hypothetical protein [Pseudomonas soli]
MSAAEYTRIRNMPLTDLRRLGAWELARFIEASSTLQRKMILQALSA